MIGWHYGQGNDIRPAKYDSGELLRSSKYDIVELLQSSKYDSGELRNHINLPHTAPSSLGSYHRCLLMLVGSGGVRYRISSLCQLSCDLLFNIVF